ncbi:MAG TPA: ArsR family transcriptional regulator, partial [Anaerolineaceae bacterium]|nr:ArsR family transcriptional regulator [Anaerolineaceae bacterium]
MKKTKDRILDQVLLLQKATISQLSDALEISEISVRHHLISLLEEGIVSSSEERHGVGRPRFIYRLTEKGFQNAPTNYATLNEHALT